MPPFEIIESALTGALFVEIEKSSFHVASDAVAGEYPVQFTARQAGYQYYKDGQPQGRGAAKAPAYLHIQEGGLTIGLEPLEVGYSMPAAAATLTGLVGSIPADDTPCLVIKPQDDGVILTLCTGLDAHEGAADPGSAIFTNQSLHVDGVTSSGLEISLGQKIDDALRVVCGIK